MDKKDRKFLARTIAEGFTLYHIATIKDILERFKKNPPLCGLKSHCMCIDNVIYTLEWLIKEKEGERK